MSKVNIADESGDQSSEAMKQTGRQERMVISFGSDSDSDSDVDVIN